MPHGTSPRMHCASAIAGFMQTPPPKMNRHTEMPKAQVVMANRWPEPWYLVPLRTVSQWTPTPKTIMRAVLRNSAMMGLNTLEPFSRRSRW